MDYIVAYWIAFAIVTLIHSIIFGFVTRKISDNKGYEGGFGWGFWLGVIGIIVVACRPDRNYNYTDIDTIKAEKTEKELQYIKQEMRKQRAQNAAVQFIKERKACGGDTMEPFLIAAAYCQTDAELRAFWEQLQPVEDAQIEAMLREREANFVATGNCLVEESLKQIKQAYPPKREEVISKTMQKDYDPNRKWNCPACGAENVEFMLRCTKCGYLR